MNKFLINEIQRYCEENSQYCQLLKKRYINEIEYVQKLAAIKQGLTCLGISNDTIKAFEEKTHLVLWLSHMPTNYEGDELLFYIGHKKMGIPISESLAMKCPTQITSLIDQVSRKEYIHEFNKELKKNSFSLDIFLYVHKSFMEARVENLLPNLFSDIERSGFADLQDVINKIPSFYLKYLSPASLAKLVKKVSLLLREAKSRLMEELKSIDLYSLRVKEQLQGLYLETDKGLKDIMERNVEQGDDIHAITQRISNLFSRTERLFLGNIYHLKDYENKRAEIEQVLAQEEELKYYADKRVLNKRIKISDVYDDYMFLNKYGSLTGDEDKIFLRALTQDFEQLHRKRTKDIPLLQKFETRGLLSVGLDCEGIKEAYHSFMKAVIIPQYIGQSLLDIVPCLPPTNKEPQRVVRDLAHLKIFALDGKNVLGLTDRKQNYSKNLTKYAETYQKCITILVYDIRGSSYMGIKLHNAIKEQRIKYKFAAEMAGIVKKYNGFLLKDTGDGGIVWFAENSGSLYNHLYTESVTGRGMKLRYSIFSGAEFDLIPAADATKRAILCARDMVQKAEEFIKANFMHYREWFAEVAERTLELDGITYALLPPEFKSLFRIGVGIASGIPDKDVVFSANSYGDPDLVGPILADAHLYAMKKQPDRSLIVCDLPSLVNLILNIENFEYAIDESDFQKYIGMAEDLRKEDYGYTLADHKISIVPRGIHFLEELNKMKALVDLQPSHFVIDDNGIVYDEHHKKVKFIYEVLNI
ncbi:MAG: hypothetical protein JSV97_11730 [candidate division WOR-3 bacterium]|nr:MAG: hypothetical protein JSV97_11730 [candidate division WOR-3 bacterium]